MTVDLPENVKRLVEERVQDCGYASAGDYLSKLVLADHTPDTRPKIPGTREELEAMLLEGLGGIDEEPIHWTPGHYARKAQELLNAHAEADAHAEATP